MQKKAKVLFPGSFDPLTNGHITLIERVRNQFGTVRVGVAASTNKNCAFTAEERVSFIQKQFEDYTDSIIVESFSGLLVDYLNKIDITLVVRGLRAVRDYEYEVQMALLNRSLSNDMFGREIDTIFLPATEKESYISSSFIKQVAQLNGDVSSFVPEHVAKALQQRYVK